LRQLTGSAIEESESSKCCGLYRNLLGSGFQGFGWWVTLLPWSNLQILVGVSRISSAPPATQILSYACLLVFVTVCRAVRFFYDYLLASSDLHLPAPFPEESARWVSRYLPEILFILSILCLSVISLLLERTRIHVFKIDRACFHWFLRLEIIVYSHKSLWIRPPLHMLIWLRDSRWLISTFRFYSKSIFVSCLDNIYCCSWIFRVRTPSGTDFQTRPAKSCSYLVLFIWVSSGRFCLAYACEITYIPKIKGNFIEINNHKKGNSIGLIARLPIDNRWRTSFFF